MKKLRRLKKGLAMLLSIAMVVGVLPGAGTVKVSAEEGEASGSEVTFTATAGTKGVSDSENYGKLIDGLYTSENGTKWCVKGFSSAYIIFESSEPVYVNGYSIVTGNDNERESGRNPKTWALYGCNDAGANSASGRNSSSWELIHSVEDDEILEDKNYTSYKYDLKNPTQTKYQYFKLEITAIHGGIVMQMSEFILDYITCEHNWVATGETVEPTCTMGGYNIEKCSVCNTTRKVSNGTPALGHDFSKSKLCTRCGIFNTIKPDGEGTAANPYQISKEEELYWFAEHVNSGNTTANAVLTGDIDFGSNKFVSIGTSSNPYGGNFDGDRHTITVNQSNSSDVAVFGRIGNCTIKNLTVTGTINTSVKFAAGIAMQVVSGCTSNIENCISDVTIASDIDGDGTHGGIIGVADGYAVINNCAFTGAMTGSSTNSCGGFIGYSRVNASITNSYIAADFSIDSTGCDTFSRNKKTLLNCYYRDLLGTVSDGATNKSAEEFAGGEVAYLLQGDQTNAVWGQTLIGDDKQAYPVLKKTGDTDNTVYQYADCAGNKAYTNDSALSGVIQGHEPSEPGVCNICGKTVYTVTVDKTGLIKADAVADKTIVTVDDTVTVTITPDDGTSFNTAPVVTVTAGTAGEVTAAGGGTYTCEITGINADTKITVTSESYNDYEVSVDKTGLTNASAVADKTKATIKDTVTVTVTPDDGTAFNTAPVVTVTAGTAGEVTAAGDGTYTCEITGINADTKITVTGKASYLEYGVSVDKAGLTNASAVADKSKATIKDTVTVTITPDVYMEFKTAPVVTVTAGTAGEVTAAGDGTYTCEITGINADTKITVTGETYYGELPKDADGVYQISTASHLYLFAKMVNSDNENFKNANAVLTADIVVNRNVLDADGKLNDGNFTSWTPIGTNDDITYVGTFDGQGHTISGLYYNTNTGYVGLFGYVESDGSVTNVGIVDSYFKGYARVGGVCGVNDGTITNCYNIGTVSGYSYVGGVCGRNNGIITNCYNIGKVSGDWDVGGVCGCNDFGTIKNCYYDNVKCSFGGIDEEDEEGKAEGRTTAQFVKYTP